jgi:primosomal protein N' (replication factor Y)
VQTFDPDHPAIQAAVRHDYARFARVELPVRADHGYPPFTGLIRIVVRGPVEAVVARFARLVAERLAEANRAQAAARVLGPAPAPIGKLRGQFRYQLQLHAADGERLRAAVRNAVRGLQNPEGVRLAIDVDPTDML